MMTLTATTRTSQNLTKDAVKASLAARKIRRPFTATREAWLEEAIGIFRPWFDKAGFPLPTKLTVAVSWAYTRGRMDSASIWGQCFPPETSRDKQTTQIAIAPWADNGAKLTKIGKKMVVTSMYHEVLNTLLHECVHAAVGTKEGHKGLFAKCCLALGYGEEDMVTTPLTEELFGRFDSLMLRLGYYPHTAIQVSGLHAGIMDGSIAIADGPKKPAPSNSKNKYEACVCESCGYKARVFTKWIREVGTPICPCNHKPMVTKGTHVGKLTKKKAS